MLTRFVCGAADYDLKSKQRQALHIECKVASSADVLRRGSGLIGTLALSDAVKVWRLLHILG